jgi:hypothetical protein
MKEFGEIARVFVGVDPLPLGVIVTNDYQNELINKKLS